MICSAYSDRRSSKAEEHPPLSSLAIADSLGFELAEAVSFELPIFMLIFSFLVRKSFF